MNSTIKFATANANATATANASAPAAPAAPAPPKFVWASVAAGGSGKKQTIEEIENKRREDAEIARRKKEEAERIELEKHREQVLRDQLVREGKEKKFAERNKARLEADKAHEKLYSREEGWWAGQDYTRAMGCGTMPVPKNVNERAKDFIARALAVWPEWQTECTTVEELRGAFYKAYVPFVLREYNTRRYYTGLSELFKYEDLNSLETSTPMRRYGNFQQWVLAEEQSHKQNPVLQAPWHMPLWVFLKHTSFENCLWALNERSSTFKWVSDSASASAPPVISPGLLRIEAGDKITWLADIKTTSLIPHQKKEFCKEKQVRLERARENWFEDQL